MTCELGLSKISSRQATTNNKGQTPGAITSHVRADRSLDQRTMAPKSFIFAVARFAAFLVVGSVAFVVPPAQQVSR